MEYEEVMFFNAVLEKLNKIEGLLTKEEEQKQGQEQQKTRKT